MLSCLEDLAQSLAAAGLRLLWRRGDPTEEIPKAAREFRASAVYWNRDYEPAAISRDRTVVEQLRRRDIADRTFKDHVVFVAGELRSTTGGAFQRYGAYRARWWSHWRAAPPAICSSRTLLRARGTDAPIEIGDWPSAADLGYQLTQPTIPGGEQAAWRRLRAFLLKSVCDYATGRNRPAVDGTSVLSPHFRFGTVSTRSAVHAALDVLRRRGVTWRSGVQSWVDELV